MPELSPEVKAVCENGVLHIRQSILGNMKAEDALAWFANQPIEATKEAIKQTQPPAWHVIIEPLIASMTDEQCKGFLAALLAVFVTVKGVQAGA